MSLAPNRWPHNEAQLDEGARWRSDLWGGVGMRSGAYHIISFFAVAPVLFFSMLESVV